MKKINPLNPMPDGTARTIKANYWKVSRTSFERNKGTYAATGAIEYEEDSTDDTLPTRME